MFDTTQRSRSLPITFTVNVAGTLVQVSNQVRILIVTLDIRLSFMHTSLHFRNPVSITSVHSATSVPTSHWTAPITFPVLSSAIASITPTRPTWGSLLRTFLGFNVCKARSLALSHVNGDASASPKLYRSIIGFLSSGA